MKAVAVSSQVEFENITYSTEVPIRENTIPTVGSAFLNIASSNPTRTHAVLQNCSGVLSPGTLTLVRCVRVVDDTVACQL